MLKVNEITTDDLRKWAAVISQGISFNAANCEDMHLILIWAANQIDAYRMLLLDLDSQTVLEAVEHKRKKIEHDSPLTMEKKINDILEGK